MASKGNRHPQCNLGDANQQSPHRQHHMPTKQCNYYSVAADAHNASCIADFSDLQQHKHVKRAYDVCMLLHELIDHIKFKRNAS